MKVPRSIRGARLLTEWRWFFSPIAAKWRGSEPYFAMCSRPALPNICGFIGARASGNLVTIA